jgi:hypothetical protein
VIYEVCPICAALTTDIEKHTKWHDVPETQEGTNAYD